MTATKTRAPARKKPAARKPATTPKKSPARRKPQALAFTAYGKQLRAALTATTIAASRDRSRPVLCAIHCAAVGGRLEMVCTDSYRLHRVIVSGVRPPKGWTAIVSADRDLIRWAIRLCAAESVTVNFDDSGATLTGGGMSVLLPTVDDDRKPNLRKIIGDFPTDIRPGGPVAWDPRLLADVAKAATAVRHGADPMQILGAEGRLRPTLFGVRNEALGLSAEMLLMPIRTPDIKAGP